MRKTIFKTGTAAVIALLIVCLTVPAFAQSGSSYCVIDGSDNTVVKQSNANMRLEMASTTKVMTALVVLENIPSEMTVRIKKEYTGVEGSSMYLKAGEVYTVHDLLCGLMLVSGNDAAVALACATAGSVEGFVGLMNEKAGQLGLKNTHFTNPHGLHDQGHYTSAYDLAVICAAAMQNDEFAGIVGSKEAHVTELHSRERRIIYNKNRFLSRFEGADGIKIGYTKNAGRCLCASASRGGKRYICVIINDPNWFSTAAYLLGDLF